MVDVMERLHRTARRAPDAIWIDDSAVPELAAYLSGRTVQDAKSADFKHAIRGGTFSFKGIPVKVFDLRQPGQF